MIRKAKRRFIFVLTGAMISATTSVVPASRDDEMVFVDTEGIELITSFDEMGLNGDLIRGIYAYGFKKPSAIQQRAIMPIIQGRNVIAQGLSGTGKTSMIAITVCQLVDTSIREVQALILSPSMEQAVKTEKLISAIGDHINIFPRAFRGGKRFCEDLGKLECGVHVVSATLGRVCDMAGMLRLYASALRLLVFDEPSVSLRGQIPLVCRFLPPNLQVVLVSATLPKEILDITSKLITDPVKILLKRDELFLEHIKQYFVAVESGELKFDTLLDVLDIVTFTQAVIFCNTKRQVDWLTEKMRSNKFSVSAMHRDMPKMDRDASMSNFQHGTTRVLLMKTDVWAPGLDVQLQQQVSLVINYDLPNHQELYINRIGRRGVTVYLVVESERDINILRHIEQYCTTRIEQLPRNVADLDIKKKH